MATVKGKNEGKSMFLKEDLVDHPDAGKEAIDAAWRNGPRTVTVNTCTADHPRALPTYLRAGFRTLRQVRELWNVPLRLGMSIPDRLRV